MFPSISPFLSSLASTARRVASNTPALSCTTPVQGSQPASRSGAGTLPGTPLVGPSSRHVLTRANRNAGTSASADADRGKKKLEKRDVAPDQPLVLSPDEDMQSKMMKFNMAMQLGQVAGQTVQSAESMDNSIVQESDAILQAVNVPTP